MDNNVIKTGSYTEFKSQLDQELKKATEGFVKIGYLLKVARDTNVLEESGYQTVAEFAKAEYGLSKDVVSRYIAINDRYSENGYSDRLQDKYNAYGVAKLQEMLTLPDTVLESIPPEMTRSRIQEVKKEIHQEEQISDLEVMMEEKNETQAEMSNNLQKFMHQYFYENKKEYSAIHKAIKKEDAKQNLVEVILDVLAPSGIDAKMVRIPGTGRLMMSIQGAEQDIILINIRSNEKETYTWADIGQAILSMCRDENAKKEWEKIYKEPFEAQEKKQEVAPVQPERKQEKQDNNSLKDRPDEKSDDNQEAAGTGDNQDNKEDETQQLPGQMKAEDYPELMPDREQEPAPVPKPDKEQMKEQMEAILEREKKEDALFAAEVAYSNLKFKMEKKDYDAALTYAKKLTRCLEMAIKEGD